MNILFLSISSISDVSQHGISMDLLREFKRNGHSVCIVCAMDKDIPTPTYFAEEQGFKIVRVQIGRNKGANLIEKGITTVLEPYRYISAIKKYYCNEKFDLVLYPTPPITQVRAVEFIKNRDGAKACLLLKDIFPQNAVDIGLMSKSGIKGLIYSHFRRLEKKLYQVSDCIGCMSQANVDYVLKHNPEVDPRKVFVCPNSIEVVDINIGDEIKYSIRNKFDIPVETKVFVYGGNLGKPQGIPFMLECMDAVKDLDSIHFIVVGAGTEFGIIQQYINRTRQKNLTLLSRLSKDDYDCLVRSCDVGLIFLDHRFTIPNFPSRLLGYLQAKIPVFAITDNNTDIGAVISEANMGWWCESNDAKKFRSTVLDIVGQNTQQMGMNGFVYLQSNYTVEKQYSTIINMIV